MAAEPAGSSRLDVHAVRPERLRDAHERAGSADPVAERRDASVGLLPDLAPEVIAMTGDHVGVVELVGCVVAGLGGELAGVLDHAADVLGGDARPPLDRLDHLELCAESAHQLEPLLGEAVGDHDPAAIALGSADERHRGSRAPARVLDHRRLRVDQPVPLGALDHGERHPVLHRAAGVEVLELDQSSAPLVGTHRRSRTSGVFPIRPRMPALCAETLRRASAASSQRPCRP